MAKERGKRKKEIIKKGKLLSFKEITSDFIGDVIKPLTFYRSNPRTHDESIRFSLFRTVRFKSLWIVRFFFLYSFLAVLFFSSSFFFIIT